MRETNKCDICGRDELTNFSMGKDIIRFEELTSANFKVTDKCGFAVQLPRFLEHRLDFTISTGASKLQKRVTFSGRKPAPMTGYPQEDLHTEFVDIVNREGLRVLEIGSRFVVHEGRKSWFHGASSYVGFDIYPGPNVDVVGDAHKLSTYFELGSFDAVCSFFVLEHIPMPWLFVMEINKVLRAAGLTFHATNFAWPLHERPWDFWRFSDQGLKVLFSKPLGFETLKVALSVPLHMYLDQLTPGHEELALGDAFGCASIIAKKCADINNEQTVWDVSTEDVLDSQYPKNIGE